MVRLNRPKDGHNRPGFNQSFFKVGQARKQKRKRDERTESERFYRERAEWQRSLRAAQAAARGTVV